MIARLASHFDYSVLLRLDFSVFLYGLFAVAAFWLAIRLCWSVRGKRWYSVAAGVVGAVALLGFGTLMIFYAAFGARGN